MGGRSRRQPLDRDRIERAALALIDHKGMAAFSLRLLAKELRVEVMSLYHWYPSKVHLLEALFDRTIEPVHVPLAGSSAHRLALALRSLRAAVCAHPGFAPYLLLHRFNTRRGLQALEDLLAVFHDATLDPKTVAGLFRFTIHWFVGVCLDETAGYAKGPSAVDPPSSREIARDFPRVSQLEPFNRPEHFDALFEAGLTRVLRAVVDATP